jgi:hypothetical protein
MRTNALLRAFFVSYEPCDRAAWANKQHRDDKGSPSLKVVFH